MAKPSLPQDRDGKSRVSIDICLINNSVLITGYYTGCLYCKNSQNGGMEWYRWLFQSAANFVKQEGYLSKAIVGTG